MRRSLLAWVGVASAALAWPWIVLPAEGAGLVRAAATGNPLEKRLRPLTMERWEYTLTNVSLEPVSLIVAGSSCACVEVALAEHRVDPGQQTKATAVSHSPAYGRVDGWFTIRARGKTDQYLTLGIGGLVHEEWGLYVAPTELRIECLGAGSRRRARLDVRLVIPPGAPAKSGLVSDTIAVHPESVQILNSSSWRPGHGASEKLGWVELGIDGAGESQDEMTVTLEAPSVFSNVARVRVRGR
jgi:hypothetical protein